MNALNYEEREKLLDATGWAILHELQQDARIPFSELGRRVGLSAPAITERVRRMEDVGIIAGYHTVINLEALGLGILAMARIRSYESRSPQIAIKAQGMPEVLECYKITGSDCYTMKIAVRDVVHLEETIDQLSTLGHVTTTIVLSSPVPPNSRPISAQTLGSSEE